MKDIGTEKRVKNVGQISKKLNKRILITETAEYMPITAKEKEVQGVGR